jgi:hypothetical protein
MNIYFRCTQDMIFVAFAILLFCPGANAQSGHWISETQKYAPYSELCNALLHRLNTVGPQCADTALETFPEFVELPGENLDPQQHIELLAKLEKYAQVGVDQYLRESTIELEEHYRLRAKEFAGDSGNELKGWHGRLISKFRDNAQDRSPTGEQTIVQMIFNRRPDDPVRQCPGHPARRGVWTFIVTPDLSGPDPRVDAGTAGVLRTNRPLLFKQPLVIEGGMLFVSRYDVFMNFETTGLVGGTCGFKLIKDAKKTRKGK